MSTITSTVASKDGTTLEYDRSGSGPPVVLLYVGPFTRAANAGLAALLAEQFTVYSYDRRGRGGSGGSVQDGPDREFEDLHAVLSEAGGSAHVYGSSAAGIIGLQAAARGLPITRLVAWEPPYSVVPGAPRPPADWGVQVARLVGEDRRGDAVAYWMTSVTRIPEQMVAGMRQAPFWPAIEAEAYGLIADYALVGDLTSDTLTEPTWSNTTVLARADAADQLRKLKRQSGQDILQYGYGPVTASLMREGMLDELRIWLHPLLVGGNDPQALLAHVGAHAKLALADVTRYDSGLVILRYRPSNGSPNPDEPA